MSGLDAPIAVDLAKLVQGLAGQAHAGEEIEVYAVQRSDVDVKVFDGEVESLSSADIAGVGVRVIREHRQGFAYAGLLDDTVATEVLAEARDNAAYGTPDEALGLPDAGDLKGEAPPLDLVCPTFGDMPTADKVRLALDLDAATKAADPRVRTVEASEYGDASVHAAVANSAGHFVEQSRTIASVSSVAIAEDENGPQTGFGYDLSRDPTTLDVEAVASEAAVKSTRMLGATQPETARVPVVLDQFAAQSLLGVLASTLNGDAVIKGRSIFADRVGERVGGQCVTIVDDPTDEDAFGATAHDAEGVPTRPVVLVTDGVLQGFAQNVYTARRLGGRTTGSAVRGSYRSTPGVGLRSVGFRPGTDHLPDLLRRAEGGVYIQQFKGLHSGVNPVSGDFSVGVDALWIRDGALASPISGSTIASTLQRMLLDIVAVGADVRVLSSGPAVHLLMSEMTLAGS